MKNKSLVKGVQKLEKLSVIAFEARKSIEENEYTSWTEKQVEKVQNQFEVAYHKLAEKFKHLNENANDYAEAFETISAREFQEEVDNK